MAMDFSGSKDYLEGKVSDIIEVDMMAECEVCGSGAEAECLTEQITALQANNTKLVLEKRELEAILKMIEFPCHSCKARDRADNLYLCFGCTNYFCRECAPVHFNGVVEAEQDGKRLDWLFEKPARLAGLESVWLEPACKDLPKRFREYIDAAREGE